MISKITSRVDQSVCHDHAVATSQHFLGQEKNCSVKLLLTLGSSLALCKIKLRSVKPGS